MTVWPGTTEKVTAKADKARREERRRKMLHNDISLILAECTSIKQAALPTEGKIDEGFN